jgi:hypothetical protein
MKLKDWLETIDYSITEGSEYTWNCYGPDAYSLDHWNRQQNGHAHHVVFDRVNQTVYHSEAHDYGNERSYRWINPEYKQAYQQEVKDNNVDDRAYDNVEYIDLETEEDFLAKARAIYLGEDYDTRVNVPLDIPKEDLYQYMLAAHERDMTLNQFVEMAVREAVKDFERDPEAYKHRADTFFQRGLLSSEDC